MAQRTHELGVRAALGAWAGALLRMVIVGPGMSLAGIGLVLGLVGALGLTRLLGTLLFGVGARDPLTLAASAAILACRGAARVLRAGTPRGEDGSAGRAAGHVIRPEAISGRR